jgi:hypothetical protein
MLGHTDNVDETPEYSDMLPNVTMKEKARTAVTLSVFTNGCKLQRRWVKFKASNKIKKAAHAHAGSY